MEFTGFSVEGSVAVFPDVDEPFIPGIVAGEDTGVAVGGADSVDPVAATGGGFFVGVFPVVCLFDVLDGGGPREDSSGRRRFSGCES